MKELPELLHEGVYILWTLGMLGVLVVLALRASRALEAASRQWKDRYTCAYAKLRVCMRASLNLPDWDNRHWTFLNRGLPYLLAWYGKVFNTSAKRLASKIKSILKNMAKDK
jgi:hypothetical protein